MSLEAPPDLKIPVHPRNLASDDVKRREGSSRWLAAHGVELPFE
jgi:hypothetical protein